MPGEKRQILGADQTLVRDHHHLADLKPVLKVLQNFRQRLFLRGIAGKDMMRDREPIGHHHTDQHLHLPGLAVLSDPVATQSALGALATEV